MPQSNKERQRLFRARINADAEARAEYLRKKRERYYSDDSVK